jgi:hypothetical protein
MAAARRSHRGVGTSRATSQRRAAAPAETKKRDPKQVVYQIGAGATQSEVIYKGAANLNLLMKDSKALGPDRRRWLCLPSTVLAAIP